MRTRTFDGAWRHFFDRWSIPYSFSCPFINLQGKHCTGNHGYRRHVSLIGTGNGYWQICGPCYRKMYDGYRDKFVSMKI